jgi:hypothetical protein
MVKRIMALGVAEDGAVRVEDRGDEAESNPTSDSTSVFMSM